MSFPLILDMTEFMLTDLDRQQCGQAHIHDDGLCDYADLSPNLIELRSGGCFRQITSKSLSPQISSFTINNNSSKRQYLYHLTGVVVHHGRGFQSGHYTAYCLNDEPGKTWF